MPSEYKWLNLNNGHLNYTNLKRIISVIVLVLSIGLAKAQSDLQIKKDLDTSQNPIALAKYKYKKKFYIDTITVYTTSNFIGIADSIAYKGKIGKVYGPFKIKKERYLLKVLAKIPNTFYHIGHIVLDTSTFSKAYADTLANKIMAKINSGESNFAAMAKTYSADNGSAYKGGDLGWFIRGIMLPQMDDALVSHKKGELFKVWTAAGLHIVKILDDPKKDDGFALILRVAL